MPHSLMEASEDSPRSKRAPRPTIALSTRRAEKMFWLTLTFVALVALLFPHALASEKYCHLLLGTWVIPTLLIVGWGIIAFEGLWGFMSAPDGLRAAPRFWLTALFPAFRLGIASATPNQFVWLPRWGWVHVGDETYQRLERRLALPMLWITLLILPVLGAEIFFSKQIEQSFLLGLAIHILSALIWFAFVVEFILLISTADDKVRVCKQNWINIVIIILPIVAFLRVIRIFRFLRVANAGKMIRAYRLRGIITRAMRLALLFNLLDRLMQRNPEKYLKNLDRQIEDAEKELAEMRAKRLRIQQTVEGSASPDVDEENSYLQTGSDHASS